MKRALGVFLVLLPSLVGLGVGFYMDYKSMLVALGITGAIVITMGLGVYLTHD